MRYFDLHCDTATACFDKHCGLEENDLALCLRRTAQYEKWAQIFAVWTNDDLRGEAAFRRFCAVSDFLADEIAKAGETASFCRTAADLKKAADENKRAALLSIEGSGALAGSLAHLEEARRRGLSLLTLTWNGHCEAGDGCGVPNAGGLTPFGRDLVRECNRLNVVVDVSHLSEKGFWDVARISRKPFVASHSDSKTVCAHRRNLTDVQFREIVKDRGLVGINLCDVFLREENAKAEDVLRHVSHFLDLGGESVLAVGSDLDGCHMAEGVERVEDMGRLYDLLAGEFGVCVADRIFWDNAACFFAENLDAE